MTDSSATLEEVLEAIADAVLQICLFQVEAKENDSHLTSPDVGPLVGAITGLSDLAKKKAMKWTETEEGANKERMLSSCAKLDELLFEISKAVDVLKIDLFNKEIKKQLMWATRGAMQQTVALLQISDRYDIRKIIRGAKQCKIDNDTMRDCRDVPRLNDVVRAYVFATVQLAKLVQGRINYIVDPVIQQQLSDANEILKARPEELIKLVVESLQNPTNDVMRHRRDNTHKKIEEAINEIVEATKLSSQEMFAGVDLELAPLDDDEEGETEYYNEPWRGATDRIAMSAARTVNSALDGKAQEAALAARALRDHVNELLNAARDRPDLAQEAQRCQDGLRALLVAMKDVLTDPSNAAARARLEDARDDLLRSARALEDGLAGKMQTAKKEDAWDPTSSSAVAQLANLEAAVNKNDINGAMQAAQKAVEALKSQAAECLASDLSPDRRREVEAAAGRLGEILQRLLAATQAALQNPNDPAVMRAFAEAINEARQLSSFFTDVLNPTGAAQSYQSPSVSFDESMARFNNAVRSLNEAVASRSLPDVQKALRDVNDAVTKQIMLARSLAEIERDPAKKQALLSGAQKMAAALPELLEATKHALSNPGDAAAQERLARAEAAMQAIQREMSNALKTPYNRGIDAAYQINELLNDEQRAVADKNRPAAFVIADSINAVMAVQAASAEQVGRGADQDALRALLDAVARAKRACGSLNVTAPAAAEKPNDAAAQRAFMENVVEARAATAAVAQCIAGQLDDSEAARTAALIADLNAQMLDEIRRGKAGEANAVYPLLAAQIAKQQYWANARGASDRDAEKRRALLAAAGTLQESLAKMALLRAEGDLDAAKQARLEALAKQVAEANLAILGSLQDCGEALQELVWTTETAVAGLQFPLKKDAQADIAAILTSLEAEVLLGKAAAAKESDPAKKSQILSAIKEVQKQIVEVKKAWGAVRANPADAKAQRDLEAALAHANLAGQKLADILFALAKLVDLLEHNARAFDDKARALDSNVRAGDSASAIPAGQIAVRRLFKQTELATRAAAGSADASLAAAARAEIKAAQQLLPVLEAKAIAATMNPKSATAAKELSQVVEEARTLNAKLTKAAVAAAKAEETSIDHGGAKDQMRDAARAVQAATANLDVDESTPKGRLNRMLQRIAEEMRNLAQAAAKGDKAAMIRAAQEIAKCVTSIVTEAKAVGKDCPNKRLVDEMMQQAFGAKNHSVSLKIIAAVKTATDDSDTTAETQLAQCAKNLAVCAISMVDASERAAIKYTASAKPAANTTAFFRPRLTWG